MIRFFALTVVRDSTILPSSIRITESAAEEHSSNVTTPAKQVAPAEKPSVSRKTRLELEWEKTEEMLKSLEERYKSREIGEKIYNRLKEKYEKELREIERKIASSEKTE